MRGGKSKPDTGATGALGDDSPRDDKARVRKGLRQERPGSLPRQSAVELQHGAGAMMPRINVGVPAIPVPHDFLRLHEKFLRFVCWRFDDLWNSTYLF